MNPESALLAINLVSAALDFLANYQINEQKFLQLRAASGGKLTQDDLNSLLNDAKAAVEAI